MLLDADRRVAQVVGVTGLRGTGNYYSTAAGSGPGGSATMTWVTVFVVRRPITSSPGTGAFFSRMPVAGTSGWLHYLDTVSGFFRAAVANGVGTFTPSNVLATTTALSAGYIGLPLVFVSTLVGGNLSSLLLGTSVTTPVVGYTAASAGTPTMIGNLTGGASPADHYHVCECAHFNGYDGTAFNSAVFGTGLVGLTAMWQEDLQQGRTLTPPQSTPNTDFHWSARDAAFGAASMRATWTDRISSVAMTRTGAPQAASVPARF